MNNMYPNELPATNPVHCHCGRDKAQDKPCCDTCQSIHDQWAIKLAPMRAEKAQFNKIAKNFPVYLNGLRVLQVTSNFVYICQAPTWKRKTLRVFGARDKIWAELKVQAGM